MKLLRKLERRHLVAIVCFAAYGYVVEGALGDAIRAPEYNWDVLPYMACARALGPHSGDVHRQVYDDLRRELGDDARRLFVGGPPYRRVMAADARAFAAQLPFYWTKPLYIVAVRVAHALGASWPRATVWPSVVGVFVLAVLTWTWLARGLPIALATLASAALVVLLRFTELAAQASPDALAAAFVVSALFALVELRRPTLAAALFFFGAMTRADVAPLGIGVLLAADVATRRALPSAWTWASVAVVGASTALVHRLSGHYGWYTLYVHTFRSNLVRPDRYVVPPFDLEKHFDALPWSRLTEPEGRLITLVAVASATTAAIRCFAAPTRVLTIPAVLGVSMVAALARWTVFPTVSVRIMASYVLSWLLLSWATIAATREHDGEASEATDGSPRAHPGPAPRALPRGDPKEI